METLLSLEYLELLKCDNCEFLGGYMLGTDECGAGKWFEYCKKRHWEGGDPKEHAEENHFWDNCIDFQPKEK